MENKMQKINEAKDYILSKITEIPEIGLILGSGLGEMAELIENPVIIEYKDIPNFPVSTVEGHKGQLVIGTLEGKKVMAMQGRFHYYEGYSMSEVTFPVYVMKAIGIKMLLVTNACGGMNKAFSAGDLMIITDHINFMGTNPLIGPNLPEFGPRFPDMSQAYDQEFISLAEKVANDQGLKIQKGVYAAISGPNYQTPSELKMLAKIGGDTVGMSTVPEVIIARHAGMRVLGISLITDMAIGEELEPLTHEQVVAVAEQSKPKFIKLVRGVLKEVIL
ncbi:purine-nucleoside phosphorylase [Vulcanibacillus modesticaldus]|uniref:Purine nucleoside phosphorylase n=1 Tax=Vulcanibacillus modesticaldus TaxID=337097 RepID=A0A1D2YSE6_9BACI|nr:purine-nucleoside phosphorylase [Vulcanibacillus modesticaldus]OEF97234.1 purine-nucleoside phosphorylase [Vulcanibacillus modesticaldus]